MGYGTKLFQEVFLDNASLIGLQRRSGEAEATPSDVTLKLHLRSCITSGLGHWLCPLLQPLVESFPLGPHAEHMVSPSSLSPGRHLRSFESV